MDACGLPSLRTSAIRKLSSCLDDAHPRSGANSKLSLNSEEVKAKPATLGQSSSRILTLPSEQKWLQLVSEDAAEVSLSVSATLGFVESEQQQQAIHSDPNIFKGAR